MIYYAIELVQWNLPVNMGVYTNFGGTSQWEFVAKSLAKQL